MNKQKRFWGVATVSALSLSAIAPAQAQIFSGEGSGGGITVIPPSIVNPGGESGEGSEEGGSTTLL
ncbi:MAG TPA: hypothetical protein VF719_07015, partial [Abditibacteriaceae bacterium]